jgi:hypothetical protein
MSSQKNAGEVEAVLERDRVMKRSHSDYIYVAVKPPADCSVQK